MLAKPFNWRNNWTKSSYPAKCKHLQACPHWWYTYHLRNQLCVECRCRKSTNTTRCTTLFAMYRSATGYNSLADHHTEDSNITYQFANRIWLEFHKQFSMNTHIRAVHVEVVYSLQTYTIRSSPNHHCIAAVWVFAVAGGKSRTTQSNEMDVVT